MSDRTLGTACLVTAAGMAWAAQDYVAPISYEPVGPRAFPLLLAALMAVAGAWLVIKPSLSGGAFTGLPWKALGYTMGAVLAYAVLFELAGFTVATAVMAVPVGMAFGGTWKQSLVGGVGLGLSLFLLFDRVLDVVLPAGWLSIVLGGH